MKKLTLKAARVLAGMTQKEAAKRLKISNSTLVKWENGVSLPTAKYVDALCSLYDLQYSDINFLQQVSGLNGQED